ncbi:hypothetical protein O181_066574 [Austropuccinia psidii MF-1]|uniref:Bud emergence protein 1 n=1 Tax=Austropuccinia psidii MF-1 TaxID=1389203 RepID=A0A9Q3ET99_9BASI|nr:hypothetical protein [Austropuccinia psidii MF-1]
MKVLRRSLHKSSNNNPTTTTNTHINSASSSSSYHSSNSDKDKLPSSSSNLKRDSFLNYSNALPTQPFSSLAPSTSSRTSRFLAGPPKLVICATENYKSNRIIELSFQKGDFFHVVGQHSDNLGDWFEASNPATGARGIVPKDLFQLFDKKNNQNKHYLYHLNHQSNSIQVNNNLNLNNNLSSTNQNQNQKSNLINSSIHSNLNSNPTNPPSSIQSSSNHHKLSISNLDSIKSPTNKSQPLYGIVQHDFLAERPDELDAKRGESIIIIAQSNHEWFVAKPIGRLGGPGLIPVSFVQVQDLTTGKTLSSDQVKDLIQNSVVPKVEEWKKATAAYKGNSIPLGKFEFENSSQPSIINSNSNTILNNPSSSNHSHTKNHHHHSTKSLSNHPSQSASSASIHLNSSRSQSISHSNHQSNSYRHQQHDSWHGTSLDQLPTLKHSNQALIDQEPIKPSTYPSNSNFNHNWLNSDPSIIPEIDPDSDGYATVDELRERYGVVVHASVESFHYEQGHFWFHLRAHFNRSVDNGQNLETTVLVLYRLYEDFFDFHVALLENFSQEDSFNEFQHSLPTIANPTDYVDELICAQRVQDLSIYLFKLCELPLHIRQRELVYEFLGPREGDVELEGDQAALSLDDKSQIDMEGEVVEYLERMDLNHPIQSKTRISSNSNSSSIHQNLTNLNPSKLDRSSNQNSPKLPTLDHRPFSSSTTTSTHKSSSPPYHLSTSSEGFNSTLPSAHTSTSSSAIIESWVPSTLNNFSNPTSSNHHLIKTKSSTINGNLSNQNEFLKIKLYQRQTDDLIAIKAPFGLTYLDLLKRIQDRVGPQVNLIRYRDEIGDGYSTGGSQPISIPHSNNHSNLHQQHLDNTNGNGINSTIRLVGIDNDADLNRWIQSKNRLILYVD